MQKIANKEAVDAVQDMRRGLHIAMDHLILAAHNLRLGTCWIGAFNPEAAYEVLELPDDVVPVAFTPLGYPNKEPRQKVRKSLADLVHYEKW